MITLSGLALHAPIRACDEALLSPDARAFLTMLSRRAEETRRGLLELRAGRQRAFSQGELPEFLVETAAIRQGDWQVAPAPDDLQDRRVEITGPTDRKMVINALNSGARVFMADFEDATSPTWPNVLDGQANLIQAVRGDLSFESPEGKTYRLAERVATLVVRPRGWHLVEKHVTVDAQPISASLFDFGLYFFHNAHELIARGSGPYFYLPKLESHLEARLWNEVFAWAQEALGLPRGTIRATVLIETIPAAFEMEEILYELREHASGLNAGRWDYIFSMIKKFRDRPDFVLPDRAQVTMSVPFMASYARLLVSTCHRRGAHAIGGMAAFVPSRRDVEINRLAIARVVEDKQREAGMGFDGTWVAHPDLVSVARREFDAILGSAPHQQHVATQDPGVTAEDLLAVSRTDRTITEAGVRLNIDVGLQYLAHWLGGLGAVALHHLMEDAATAEISRAQLWQWLKHEVPMADGTRMTRERYKRLRDEVLSRLEEHPLPHLAQAAALLDDLVLAEGFVDFLTLPAYQALQP